MKWCSLMFENRLCITILETFPLTKTTFYFNPSHLPFLLILPPPSPSPPRLLKIKAIHIPYSIFWPEICSILLLILNHEQERLAASHGSQCGFCTPGIVMSMYTLLRNNQEPCMRDIFGAFEGNLCRCTGYRPILEGYRTFTKVNITSIFGHSSQFLNNIYVR